MNSIQEYFRGLVSLFKQDAAHELAISYLSPTGKKIRSVRDERQLCAKIHSKLSSVSSRDAEKFDECYSKLKQFMVFKQRAAVLTLLLSLSESPQPKASTHQLFPVPTLPSVKSGTGISATTMSSKSTVGSVGWESIPPKQGSNQSLPSSQSNMALAVQALDGPNERSCVRDVVLAATGIKSRGAGNGPRPMQMLYARVAHLGFLHDRLKEFIDPSSGLMPQGLMGEGLVSSIREELTEYYRSVALLQSQACEGDGGGATLRRICVWAQEPLHRLTWLANIAHTAYHKKGGELASCVHRFVRHGDERVVVLARRLLTSLTYPLLLMLTRWLLHGEIDDPFNEFFIESRSGVEIERMWHDKYRVREWMMPSFISRDQAAQILATGKSVVFMREACPKGSTDPSDHADCLEALLKHTSESDSTIPWWEAEGFRESVASAHTAVSRRLLDALTTHHHIVDHLVAHRRYLLFSQGDFVHHLMTLLKDELNKPATSLFVHNLTCTLEAAVRATSAQHEPPHVLESLHVNLYHNGDGRDECGWDVFALQYHVSGPLGTLFPPACAARYRALFSQLWRVKRIEQSLYDAWLDHAILQKKLKHMPEVWGLMRRVSCLRAEALRLCGALQEASGVSVEPAWDALLTAAAARRPLDTLLRLHHAALERHAVHAMIHHTTQELQSYLGNVLTETLALRRFESKLNAGINAELDRRDRIEQLKGERVARGEFAITAAEEAKDKEERKVFLQFLASRKADLNVWARTYRVHVTSLILKLALHGEVSLQTLAFRLDYSDFYKRGDAKLHHPLTYQHKRLSEIGIKLDKTKVIDRPKKK
ncbi:gamma-tubulin complex component 3 isoform X2 [Choristoneura fumiferana]|uniref:gamma-tubulin complex component 3 isoform X2 n=1 Tax=Choristoneura fumiferana TaxID=7141 RepID=UPI003D154127